MIEKRTTQPQPEALRRIGRQMEVLVHVKCRDPRPVDVFFFTKRGEHLALAGRGGEDHAHVRLRLQACTNFLCDVGGCGRTHGLPPFRDVDGDGV